MQPAPSQSADWHMHGLHDILPHKASPQQFWFLVPTYRYQSGLFLVTISHIAWINTWVRSSSMLARPCHGPLPISWLALVSKTKKCCSCGPCFSLKYLAIVAGYLLYYIFISSITSSLECEVQHTTSLAAALVAALVRALGLIRCHCVRSFSCLH